MYLKQKKAIAAYIFFIGTVFIFSPALLIASEVPSENTSEMIMVPNFSKIIKDLTPVTVNISTTKTITQRGIPFGSPFGRDEGGGMDPFGDFFGEDFFRRFFGDEMPREYKQQSLGSGFIIDAEGYIITNNHVVEGADIIKVTHQKKEYDAEIIGRDPKTDIALIKIKELSEILPVAKLGDSDRLEVGEWVIAIGNPFGLDETVTAGIVSAKWRRIGAGPYEDFIQTDASINPGNSGGPLFNLKGEVVGVNTMIYSPSGGNVGIGFAIPVNIANNVVAQLREKGRVVRGWLGVVVQTVTPELANSFGLEENKGALIADIDKEGPAFKAGMQPGDIIVKFNDKEINEMSELPLIVADTPVGEKVKVEVLRDGKKKTFSVTIGELKDLDKVEKQEEPSQGALGLGVQQITPELAERMKLEDKKGVIVSDVKRGSPADEAGIKRGDIIKEVNRKPVSTVAEYNQAIKDAKKENILLLVRRGQSSIFIVVKQK